MNIAVKIKDKEFIIENAENYSETSIIKAINDIYWPAVNMEPTYEVQIGRDNYEYKIRKLKNKQFKNISFTFKTYSGEYDLENKSIEDFIVMFSFLSCTEKKDIEEEILLDVKLNLLWSSLDLKAKKNLFNIMSGVIGFSGL